MASLQSIRALTQSQQPPPMPALLDDSCGDVLHGAKAISLYGSDERKYQRRVFNLWAKLRFEEDALGFFKTTDGRGTICLSKRLWLTAVKKQSGAR
jgi:hypothetical protein